MFERFTERARRALFFSRYEASQLGSPQIEAEHVLLGILRENAGLVDHILSNATMSRDALQTEIEKRATFGEKVPTSVEIPFAEAAKWVLRHCAEEADALSHKSIGVPHMLLGVLRLDPHPLVSFLVEHGVTLDSTRAIVAKEWRDEGGAVII